MVDALWIAASGVAYAMSEGARPNVVLLDFKVDRHPCDDLPYVANINPYRMFADGALIDGCQTQMGPSPTAAWPSWKPEHNDGDQRG